MGPLRLIYIVLAAVVKQLTHLAVNQTSAGATPVSRPKLVNSPDIKSGFFLFCFIFSKNIDRLNLIFLNGIYFVVNKFFNLLYIK